MHGAPPWHDTPILEKPRPQCRSIIRKIVDFLWFFNRSQVDISQSKGFVKAVCVSLKPRFDAMSFSNQLSLAKSAMKIDNGANIGAEVLHTGNG